MKRLVSFVLLSALALLAACGQFGSDGNANNVSSVSTRPSQGETGAKGSADKVKLEFWYSQQTVIGDQLQKLVDRFNESQSEIEVQGVNLADAGALTTKLQAALVAGNQPALAMLATAQTGEYALANTLEDLHGFFSKEELGQVHDNLYGNALINGKLAGIPYNRSTMVMYFNKTKLRDAGLNEEGPKNWEEMHQFALKLTDEKTGNYGFAMPMDVIFFEIANLQQGGKMFSEDYRKIAFDGGSGERVVRFYQNMVKDGSMRVPTGTGTASYTPIHNDFLSGKLGMMFSTSAVTTTMLQSTKDKFELGVAMLPAGLQYGATTNGYNLCVLAKAPEEQKRASVAFIKFLLEKENTAEMSVGTGYIPNTKDAVESEAIKDLWTISPQYRVAYEQLQYAQPRPVMKGYAEAGKAIQDEFKNALLDPSITPEQAIKSIADKVQHIIDEQQ